APPGRQRRDLRPAAAPLHAAAGAGPGGRVGRVRRGPRGRPARRRAALRRRPRDGAGAPAGDQPLPAVRPEPPADEAPRRDRAPRRPDGGAAASRPRRGRGLTRERKEWTMKRVGFTLAVAAALLCAGPARCAGPVRLPDTPVGKQARRLLE